MLVAFWGPAAGQTSTSSSMIAVAALLALDYPLKIAITHNQQGETVMEKSFSKLRFGTGMRGTSGGLDAILRLSECDLLTPITLRDHTESILKERLDLIAGAQSGEGESFTRALPRIIHAALRYYDILFFDLGAGYGNAVTEQVLKQADLVVVTLNQNEALLDKYFASVARIANHGKGKRLFCVGSYEPASRLSLNRMMKNYRMTSKEIVAIPRSVRYMDAMNDGNILDYILRAMSVRKRLLEYDGNVSFIAGVRQAGRKVLELLDLAPPEEVDLEAQ